MNSQFHTPSLGDEVFDLSGIDDVGSNYQQMQQENFGSKRLQNMEHNFSVSGGVGVGGVNYGSSFGVNNEANFPPNYTPQTTATPTVAARKQMSPGVTDPDEPAKPLSPYAYFFRETVSTIKQQNPACNFDQLTSIVASMWEVLDPVQKEVFVKKSQIARVEYTKKMRMKQQKLQAQQSQLLQQQQQQEHNFNVNATEIPPSTVHQPPVAAAENIVAAENIANQAAEINQNQVSNQLINLNESKPSNDPSPEVKSAQDEVIEIRNGIEPCIREGCDRMAVMNPDWEDEYCSNECVVIHCRNVFNAWVQQNKDQAATPAV